MDLSTSHSSYRFGPFELSISQRKLFCDGHEVLAGSRAVDLLIALVEGGGRTISRSDLLAAVWPRLVVEGSNVAVQVFALRKLMGRHAIATVPGRGYRFALPLPRSPQANSALPAAVATPIHRISALPAAPALLFGRDKDLADLHARLATHRLVTVVGSAGIGKTTLVLALARSGGVPEKIGVVWIDLSTADRSSGVLRFIALALGLPIPEGPQAPLRLVSQLQTMRLLLIIDNAEQVSAEVASFAHLMLQSGADVRLLVTSQKALKVNSECLFRLGPLAVPTTPCSPDDAMAYGAVALFVEQARLLDKRFELTRDNVESVIALCLQLDGIALAIKLAASRVPDQGLNDLGRHMGERFLMLESRAPNTPPRQLALRAALDWSHALLNEPERRVFRRLGVFVGGFTLMLASETCKDATLDSWGVEDALEGLVDHSLVVVDEADEPRYRLLESARAYALLKLDEAGEGMAVRQRHAAAVHALCIEASLAYAQTPDLPWLAVYAPDIDNVRAAIDWSSQHDPDTAVALLGEAGDLFTAMSLLQEARERYRACSFFVLDGLPPAVLAKYWLGQSRLLFTNDQRVARDFAFKAIDYYRDCGDTRQLYVALGHAAHITALTSTAQAREMLDEQIRIEQPDWPPRVRRIRLVVDAFILMQEGQLEKACQVLERALLLAREAGAARMAASDLSSLATVYMMNGDSDYAIRLGQELVDSLRMHHDITRLMALGNLSSALLAGGRPQEVRPVLIEFFGVSRILAGDGFGTYSDVYAQFAASEGRFKAAALLLGYADHSFERMGKRVAIAEGIRAKVWAKLECHLAPDDCHRLMQAGALMNPDQVRDLALGIEPAGSGNPAQAEQRAP